MTRNNPSDFIVFKTEDENVSVNVRFEEETVWLTQEQRAILLDKVRRTIAEDILNVYQEKELKQGTICRKFRHVQRTTQYVNNIPSRRSDNKLFTK